MSISEADLKQRYAQLSDEQLLVLWQQNTLTDEAKTILKNELLSRGLQPPEPMGADEVDVVDEVEPLITIAQFSTAPEAHILRARLEADGIPAVVADEHLVTANWLLSNAVGGVRVRIPASFAEQANTILRELELGAYALADEVADTISCPRCQSTQTAPYRRSRKISILSLFILNLPLPFYKNEYKCKACGHVWKQR